MDWYQMDRALRTLQAAMASRPYFSFADYISSHPASRSTAWRDFKKLLATNEIKPLESVNGDMRTKVYELNKDGKGNID